MVCGTNDNIVDTFSFICTSKCHGVMYVELLPEVMLEIIIEPTLGTFYSSVLTLTSTFVFDNNYCCTIFFLQ